MYDSPANGNQLIIPQDAVKRNMRALFDYDPRELSPNPDIEMELAFRQGDTLYVFGEMDDDGFFIVSDEILPELASEWPLKVQNLVSPSEWFESTDSRSKHV